MLSVNVLTCGILSKTLRTANIIQKINITAIVIINRINIVFVVLSISLLIVHAIIKKNSIAIK